MERNIMSEIYKWYESKDDRILFVCGAPGVGKTWLTDKLCRTKRDRYVRIMVSDYMNRKKSNDIQRMVSCRYNDTDNGDRLLNEIDTLIVDGVIDEKTLNVARKIILRLRMEECLPKLSIIVEGTVVDTGFFYEYGIDEEYVKIVKVYPMSFAEFKTAIKKKHFGDDCSILKMYLVTGGLPVCVKYFVETGDFTGVRHMQKGLLEGMLNGKSKKYLSVLKSIPKQLSERNAGFSYRGIDRNAREREYGDIIDSMEKQGIIYKAVRLGETDRSLRNSKLYLYDVGITGAIMDISERVLMEDNMVFCMYNELLARTFMVMEFYASSMSGEYTLSYWYKKRAKARLPLIMQRENINVLLIPLCRRSYDKSILSFMEKYENPKIYKLKPGIDGTANLIERNLYKDVEVRPMSHVHKIFINEKNIIKENLRE